MTEFRQASKLGKVAKGAQDLAVKKVLPAGATGAAAYYGYKSMGGLD
jgi:hypothetical protein